MFVHFAGNPQQTAGGRITVGLPKASESGVLYERTQVKASASVSGEIYGLENDEAGIVFNIQRYQIHDGPGIRTLVLLKGCPLRCQWCSNPEGQKHDPQLYYIKAKCKLCAKCVEVCSHEANVLVDGQVVFKKELCVNCGECVEQCLYSARDIRGKSMSVEEVVKEVERDRSFYFVSGGGITIGGGEPLAQPKFTRNILRACKSIGIHTAIETSLLGRWEDLKEIVASTDWVFCDLKNVDQEMHKKGTGLSNEGILENCKRLSEVLEKQDTHLTVRVPVIPGFNDSEARIVEIAEFVKTYMKAADEIELLRYHSLALGKYDNLGIEYPLGALAPSSEPEMLAIKGVIEKSGLKCIYEGEASQVYVGAR